MPNNIQSCSSTNRRCSQRRSRDIKSLPQQELHGQNTHYNSHPQQQELNTHSQPGSAQSATATSPTQMSSSNGDPRSPAGNTTLFSLATESANDRHHSSYNPQFSPKLTETEGTTGNPVIRRTGEHFRAAEVDGTGNIRSTIAGHGNIPQIQRGGSPTTAEVDGRVG